MADGAEIKSRIASITETKKVTDAMYMIASVKMRKARREVEQTQPYFDALREEIAWLVQSFPETGSRYFSVPEPTQGAHWRHAVLLVTSDKGLCGAYNQNVIALCESVLARHPQTVLYIVGEYGRQYFASKKVPFVESFRYSSDLPSVWKTRRICADLLDCYHEGQADEISVIYTDYQNGKPAECRRRILLPLERASFLPREGEKHTTDREFYPDPDTVLNGVMASWLTGFLYGALVDSYCSEQQSRMQAMDSASSNAGEMLSKLRLQYNSVRQAAITREMTEITAGAKALLQKETRRETIKTEQLQK